MRVSLAAKCRILFSLAVLLIIATALLVPWYYMERLVDELNVRRARHMALIARDHLQPAQTDWENQQTLLEQWWRANADSMQLPSVLPRFVRKDELEPPDDPFLALAMRTLSENDQLREYRSREPVGGGHSMYRLALAVRTAASPQARPSLVGLVAVQLPSHESDAQLWLNRIVIITAGALAGFLAILVFYLITHKLILSPIRDLKAVVEKVSAGDLSVRSGVATGDEFEELSLAINNMLANLQKSQEELQAVNRSLDIRLGELAQTNVALYEANKLKSEFLANVSHELRTPLTSIIGFAELLRDAAPPANGSGDWRIGRYATNILVSGRNLLDLINDLLDLVKIEAGRMELHRTRFGLREVCEALADFVRPLADKKELTLEVVLGEDLPTMHSDAGRIKQVLYNLLSNAIKFTPPSGTVRLEAHRHGNDEVRLVVSDTGPGIPPEQHAVIFEKFRQLDSSVTREHSGSGLGLPISRDLVHMLGGRLMLDSRPGAGTTFTVILPLECPEKANVPLVSLT